MNQQFTKNFESSHPQDEEENSSSGIGSDNDAIHHRNNEQKVNVNSPANLLIAASGEGNGVRYSSGRTMTKIPDYRVVHQNG